MFQRILVANDGSKEGKKALDCAIDVALKFDAKLHMIVVEEMPIYGTDMEVTMMVVYDMHEQYEKLIQESIATAKDRGLLLETHLIQGFPGSTIADFAKNYNFELLVVGFMEHSAFYRWFVGSTTDELVDYVPCSVLVVK
jgi:nucleotide-binding universal stress UspA family protein